MIPVTNTSVSAESICQKLGQVSIPSASCTLGLELGHCPADPIGAWNAFMESYPSEVLLRVRIAGRTVLLDRLTPQEVAWVRAFPDRLDTLAIIHLRSRGL